MNDSGSKEIDLTLLFSTFLMAELYVLNDWISLEQLIPPSIEKYSVFIEGGVRSLLKLIELFAISHVIHPFLWASQEILYVQVQGKPRQRFFYSVLICVLVMVVRILGIVPFAKGSTVFEILQKTIVGERLFFFFSAGLFEAVVFKGILLRFAKSYGFSSVGCILFVSVIYGVLQMPCSLVFFVISFAFQFASCSSFVLYPSLYMQIVLQWLFDVIALYW